MTLRKSATEEIASNLINLIGKVASATEDFKRELALTKKKSDVDDVYNKYKGALKMEPTQEDWETICNVKKAQFPEANDGMLADDKNQRQLKDGLIYRHLNTLCGIADEFDLNGYEKFAKHIDEIIEKLSKEAFKK